MLRSIRVIIFWVMGAIVLAAVPNTAGPPAENPRAAGPDPLAELQWRNVGPANPGGRVDDFAVVEDDPRIFYVGSASGGLWKTENAGTTWTPVFDNQETSTIGDVTLSLSDPDIIWVGTGEANNRQSSSWGCGVYKSTDAGLSWTNTGLRETHHVGRIVIHPRNPDIVYVAALGRLWGPNPERGVFKTEDGGRTWNKSLYIDEDTGCVDLAMDSRHPGTVYAAAYQRRRTPWGFNGGGPGGGIFKTTDGGATWRRLAGGLPTGDVGRIGLDVCRNRPEVVYAVVEHAEGGVFRSEDKGETWSRMSDDNPRPMYYSKIRVDPNNDLRVWLLGDRMFYSQDGGRTWDTRLIARVVREKRAIHGDHHAMWIDPRDSDHMLVGSDGGVYISFDHGRKWVFRDNLPIAQAYEVDVDLNEPYNIGAGLQDNGTWFGPSAAWFRPRITNDEWFKIGGSDGFHVQFDPVNPDRVYVESQFAGIELLNRNTGEYRSLRPIPDDPGVTYRFNWNAPFKLSPHDPGTVMLGGDRLFISRDGGGTWKASRDLTRGLDRERLPIMGRDAKDITLSKHDGILHYGTITTIDESPLIKGLIYVGTDDGLVQISEDGGESWRMAGKRPGVPERTYVSRIEASHAVPDRAYAAFDGHRGDDFRAHILMTEDRGASWTRLSDGLPEGGTVSVVREHPRNPRLLFAGTERGGYYSPDRGKTWRRFRGRLPMVPVDDIAVHPRDNDLIFGTHGRGVWILDDITPLERFVEETGDRGLALFDIRPAVIRNFFSRRAHYDFKGLFGHAVFRAPNPPYGALINYHLAEDAGAEAEIVIRDDAGGEVCVLSGPGSRGLHRIVWDLRYGYDAPSPPAKPEISTGPSVVPGRYSVTVRAGGKAVEKAVDLRMEAEIDASPQAIAVRRDALIRIYRVMPALSRCEKTVRRLREDLKRLAARMLEGGIEDPELAGRLKILRGRLVRIEGNLHGRREWGGDRYFHSVSGLRRIAASLERVTAAPGDTDLERIRIRIEMLRQAAEDLNRINGEAIPDLNRRLNAAGLAHVRPGGMIDIPENRK